MVMNKTSLVMTVSGGDDGGGRRFFVVLLEPVYGVVSSNKHFRYLKWRLTYTSCMYGLRKVKTTPPQNSRKQGSGNTLHFRYPFKKRCNLRNFRFFWGGQRFRFHLCRRRDAA